MKIWAMVMLLVAGSVFAQGPYQGENMNNTIIIYKDDGTYVIYRGYTYRNSSGDDVTTIIYPPSYFEPNTGGSYGTYGNPGSTQRDWTAPPSNFYQYDYTAPQR